MRGDGDKALVAVLKSASATSELASPAGVGFVIGERHVLTCSHVVNTALGRDKHSQEKPSKGDRLRLSFPLVGADAPEGYAEVVAWYPPPAVGDRRSGIADVAGLELEDGLPADAVPATLGHGDHAQKLYVFGYPADPPRLDNGAWVPCWLRGPVGGGLIQIDSDNSAALRAQPGYSGSPLVDRARGLVVGMLSLASMREDKLDCYAIPAETLCAAISRVTQVRFEEGPASGASPRPIGELLAGYRMQAKEICPRFLTGRHDELAELADFCAGSDQYAWWQAPPYAGKSALMAWFVSNPSAALDVVSFFVVSQFPDQANSKACADALTKQLMMLLGKPLLDSESAAVQRSLLELRIQAAAERSVRDGRRLLLVIDGIGEDRGTANGLPSIASLLPQHPPDGLRVLVASRPLLRIPDDVHEEHPLRRLKPRSLAPSRHAGGKERRAKQEIEQLSVGGELHRDVLGLITAAGSLSESELKELTGRSRSEIIRLVDSSLGHSLTGEVEPFFPARGEFVLGFAHETIREAVIQLYGGGDLNKYCARIQDWANTYRVAGWPENTPRHLLRDYFSILAHNGNIAGLVACATDKSRHDRMLRVTGSDALALSEMEQARDMLDVRSDSDGEQVNKICVERSRIVGRSGLMTADDVRERFQITWSLDEEIVHDLLPPPISLGRAGHAWNRSDVERLVRLPERTSGRCTVDAMRLAAARPPLERRNDLCIDFRGTRVHVRVWEGSAEESHRLVVLIGALHDQMNLIVNRIEELATTIDYRLLDGRGATAVWFDYLHGYSDYDDEHRFSNIVMRNVRPSLVHRLLRRSRIKDLSDRDHFMDPNWRPISVAEIGRVIGRPVECYPKHAYTESIVEKWKNGAGETVDVEHDPASIRKFLECITLIEDVPPTDPYAAMALDACTVLAHEITMRNDDPDRAPWNDGTHPDRRGQGLGWPRLFAARLFRADLTQRDKERIARYPDDNKWPWSPEEFSRRTSLLAQLRNWAIDIGELGDHPDPGLCAAVERTVDVLHYWISVANRDFLEEDYPDRRVWGTFEVAGDYDQWYLAYIDWQQGPEETQTPIHRQLRKKFYEECGGHIRFGKDPWGRLVAHDEGNERGCGNAQFAVDWPQRPPVDGIPDEAYIVADKHEAGNRAVYIELPDGQLDLLPRPPNSWSGWSFGNSDSGPLERAISRTFQLVDGIDKDQFPSGWIEQQVCHSDEAQLRISVRDIRARYRPSA